jgi:tRNA U34 5-carboxymethylaminomethyl modifying GTPase MnmE/TrmE
MENMSIEEIETYREKLLKAYHTKKEDIDFAEDDMEEAWIEEELDKYRIEIRACAAKINELKEQQELDA